MSIVAETSGRRQSRPRLHLTTNSGIVGRSLGDSPTYWRVILAMQIVTSDVVWRAEYVHATTNFARSTGRATSSLHSSGVAGSPATDLRGL